MEEKEIKDLVIETIKEFVDNNGIETEEITESQRLIGRGGIFDSIGLVNFLVDLEEVLEEKYDREFNLSSEVAMSRTTSPFLNPVELTKFILELDEE
jgi:acyl carrier protein